MTYAVWCRTRVTHVSHIDEKNAYFQMIRSTWGSRLKQVFSEIEAPQWAVRSEQLKLYKPVRDGNPELMGIDNTPTPPQLSLGT